ncbi:T9SS type A sorting domain-containing protein [Limnovirga soli]|nr:T9SS type A sorting domain-containing protein [Limnovirga soli]
MKSLLILLVLVNCMYISKAQPGTLDSSFGANGKVLGEAFQGVANSMIVQPDGKIVIGGTQYGEHSGFLVARYNMNGTLDINFGDSGRAVNNLGDVAFSKIIYSIALQKDGKIVAVGQYASTGDNSGFAIMRFNSDGSIDKQFGDNGLTITSVSGNYDIVRDMGILPDGTIIVTGDTEKNPNDNKRSFLASYNSSGNLNESFGNKGILIITLIDVADIRALGITNDSKIIIGGYYKTFEKSILLKFNSDGNADKSFGNNGLAELSFNSNIYFNQLNDIAINPDNSIVATGFVQQFSNEYYNIIAEKFLSNGTPDSSFGTNAYSLIGIEKKNIYANSVLSESNGKVIASGYYVDKGIGYFLVSAFTKNGKPDSTFGINGIQTTSFEGSGTAYCSALQEDGKILLAGTNADYSIPRYQVAITRYMGNGSDKLMYVKIKHWLHHHGITWENKPNNLINYYSIQSSTNGNAFTEVARIFSNHHGGIQTYTAANNATANYRVAAISNTGNITYSNTLTLTATPTIQLYPNPAKNNLHIQGLPAGTTKLTVTDISGNTSIIATTNSTVYSINIAQLTSGNYLLHIKTANEVITKQFIKE